MEGLELQDTCNICDRQTLLTYKTRGNLNYQSDTTTEDKAPSCASHGFTAERSVTITSYSTSPSLITPFDLGRNYTLEVV